MNKIKNLILVLVLIAGINVYGYTQLPSKTLTQAPVQTQLNRNITEVNPLSLVAHPASYINKTVKIRAKFDKFTTLGLDYKPAMRSSENYISFLIQRPDVTDHNIPLSELKIFINRTEAEKYIDLNSGDIVEFTGKVFSSALGDPWMDAETFTVVSTKSKIEN